MWKRLLLFTTFFATIYQHSSASSLGAVRHVEKPTHTSKEELIHCAFKALHEKKTLIAQEAIRHIIRHIPDGKYWIELYQERIKCNQEYDMAPNDSSVSNGQYYQGIYAQSISKKDQVILCTLNELIQQELSSAARSAIDYDLKHDKQHENKNEAFVTTFPFKPTYQHPYEQINRKISRSASLFEKTRVLDAFKTTRNQSHYSHNTIAFPPLHNDQERTPHRPSLDSKNSFLVPEPNRSNIIPNLSATPPIDTANTPSSASSSAETTYPYSFLSVHHPTQGGHSPIPYAIPISSNDTSPDNFLETLESFF